MERIGGFSTRGPMGLTHSLPSGEWTGPQEALGKTLRHSGAKIAKLGKLLGDEQNQEEIIHQKLNGTLPTDL